METAESGPRTRARARVSSSTTVQREALVQPRTSNRPEGTTPPKVHQWESIHRRQDWKELEVIVPTLWNRLKRDSHKVVQKVEKTIVDNSKMVQVETSSPVMKNQRYKLIDMLTMRIISTPSLEGKVLNGLEIEEPAVLTLKGHARLFPFKLNYGRE